MIVTFFDTETTGLLEFKKPLHHPEQPRVIQLALLMIDTATWNPIMKLSTIVAQDVESGAKALETHGITKQMSQDMGIQPKTAAAFLRHYAARSDRMVAHNKTFDIKMLTIEQLRTEGDDKVFEKVETFCTMEAARNVCKIPPSEKMVKAGIGGYKAPNLTEAHTLLLGHGFEGAHDALVDTEACMRVYRKLLEMGEIKE